MGAGLQRIILHWTAGSYKASRRDRDAYHFIVEGDGTVVEGDYPPEANAHIRPPHYAAHTGRGNTGSIGVSVAAMHGAHGWPRMVPGRYPITDTQLDAMAKLVADLCRRYDIPITRRTVLTHAEVEPTLGIKQRGKWDIRWLPGMTKVGDPIGVGDTIRAMVDRAYRDLTSPPAVTEPRKDAPKDHDPALMTALDRVELSLKALEQARLVLDEALRPKD